MDCFFVVYIGYKLMVTILIRWTFHNKAHYAFNYCLITCKLFTWRVVVCHGGTHQLVCVCFKFLKSILLIYSLTSHRCIDVLIDVLIDWLFDWLIDWSIDWLIDFSVSLIHSLTHSFTCSFLLFLCPSLFIPYIFIQSS